jgi:hypothetical protein
MEDGAGESDPASNSGCSPQKPAALLETTQDAHVIDPPSDLRLEAHRNRLSADQLTNHSQFLLISFYISTNCLMFCAYISSYSDRFNTIFQGLLCTRRQN